MRPPVGIRIAVQESTLIRLAYGQPPSPLQGEGYFAPGALAQKTQAQCENRTRNKFCTPRAQSGPEENAGKHSWFCVPEMKNNLSGARPP